MLDDLLVALAGNLAGNGEADSLIRLADDRRVDADHLPAHVDQRAAAVAGIYGRVGLHEILVGAVVRNVPALLGADNARGHGAIEPKRAADRQYPVAHFQLVAVAPLGRSEMRGGDLQHGQIGQFVVADELHFIDRAAVGEMDRDIAGVLDHVAVRENVARFVDDKARSLSDDRLPVLRQHDHFVVDRFVRGRLA